MCPCRTTIFAFSIYFSFAVSSFAETTGIAGIGAISDKAGIPLGLGQLYPTLNVKMQHNDNLLRRNTAEVDTFVSILSPAMVYKIQSNKSLISLEYIMDVGEHYSSHNDDYIDNAVRAEFQYEPTHRVSTAIRGEYVDTRDERGTGASEGGLTSNPAPDEYHTLGIMGEASYGADTAQGRFEFDFGYKAKDYDNNRATTFVRDRNDMFGSGRFFYQIMPKTGVVFDVRGTNFNYEQDAVGRPGLDSTTMKYLAGVTWEATFKTTGFAKFGLIDKQFDSDDRKDRDALLWEVGVEWQPRTYSTFVLSTQRDFSETNGTGDFIEENTVNIEWQHEWPGNISSNFNFTFAKDDYTTARKDDRINTGVSINYEMHRWLKLGVGYTYDERDSNTTIFDYERNIFELTAFISL